MSKKQFEEFLSDNLMIVILSGISYFVAGLFVSLTFFNSIFMWFALAAFFIGIIYDGWAIKKSTQKSSILETRVETIENNLQDIGVILHDIKDILKKMN